MSGYWRWHQAPGYGPEIAAALPRAHRLLDVGGGTGWLGALTRHQHYVVYEHPGIETTALETAHGQRFVFGDLDQPLPFRPGAFAVAVAKDVLEHMVEPIGLVRELHRVLEAGGHLYVSVPGPSRHVWDDYTHKRPYTRLGLARLLEDVGFSVTSLRHESVVRGSEALARLNRGRRPKPLHWVAGLGIGARNVVAAARK